MHPLRLKRQYLYFSHFSLLFSSFILGVPILCDHRETLKEKKMSTVP